MQNMQKNVQKNIQTCKKNFSECMQKFQWKMQNNMGQIWSKYENMLNVQYNMQNNTDKYAKNNMHAIQTI